jgi:hypothetical protein
MGRRTSIKRSVVCAWERKRVRKVLLYMLVAAHGVDMEKETHITENEGAAGTKIGTDDAAMAHGGVVRGARPATALSRICGCGGGGQGARPRTVRSTIRGHGGGEQGARPVTV